MVKFTETEVNRNEDILKDKQMLKEKLVEVVVRIHITVADSSTPDEELVIVESNLKAGFYLLKSIREVKD